MQEIRIPQGMRDLTAEESRRKEALRKRIESVFDSFGYQKICTPTIEYADTYDIGFTSADTSEMYRFLDQDGKMVMMRVDMTVPIARLCASKYYNARPPFRFRYCSEVFKVRHTFAGKRSQVTDCGIELIGLDDHSDIEVLYTADRVMRETGDHQYRIEIGNSGFFRKAAEELNLDDDQKSVLADLIDRKSLVQLHEYLLEQELSDQARSFFEKLPLLGGGSQVLQEAMEISFCPSLKEEVEKLMKLDEGLRKLGVIDHFSYDFGKVPHLDYYTGIIFEGYVSGVGASVLSGGRYDTLLSRFGRDLPACGFSIKLDSLLDVLPKLDAHLIRICYPVGSEIEALQLSEKLREEGNTELVPWDKDTIEVIR
ncbi:MAG: ATP phosphoribosyltransferase regulatory subunit [Bulleidia sp.]